MTTRNLNPYDVLDRLAADIKYRQDDAESYAKSAACADTSGFTRALWLGKASAFGETMDAIKALRDSIGQINRDGGVESL